MTRYGITVVIPVYNGAASLDALIERLQNSLDSLARPYEVILVNDGSRDDSWRVIQRLIEERPFVKGMDLMRNYGQHNALLAGVRAAQYDMTVTMDDDLQHDPADIGVLLNELNRGYDVVYGTPAKKQHGPLRGAASTITRIALGSVMNIRVAENVSAFRVFRTELREAFAAYCGPFVSIDVLLTWGTSSFTALPVPHHPRAQGHSNYTFRKLMAHAMDMMTGFSTFPLRIASVLGFLMAVFGLGILVYVVGRYFMAGGSVPGFPFLASVIAIFSGVQLFAFGLFGEYLARMHFRIMNKPSYAIRQTSQRAEVAGGHQISKSE